MLDKHFTLIINENKYLITKTYTGKDTFLPMKFNLLIRKNPTSTEMIIRMLIMVSKQRIYDGDNDFSRSLITAKLKSKFLKFLISF